MKLKMYKFQLRAWEFCLERKKPLVLNKIFVSVSLITHLWWFGVIAT